MDCQPGIQVDGNASVSSVRVGYALNQIDVFHGSLVLLYLIGEMCDVILNSVGSGSVFSGASDCADASSDKSAHRVAEM